MRPKHSIKVFVIGRPFSETQEIIKIFQNKVFRFLLPESTHSLATQTFRLQIYDLKAIELKQHLLHKKH